MVRRVLDLELLNTRLIRERQEADDLGEHLRRILDELPQMVVVRSMDGEILFANHAAEVSHGTRLAEWGALANHAVLVPEPTDDLAELDLPGGDPFQPGDDDELVEFQDLSGHDRLLFVRERPFPLGGGEMAVLQLAWDAESYMPSGASETRELPGVEDRKVKVPKRKRKKRRKPEQADPLEPLPDLSVEDLAHAAAAASAPEPSREPDEPEEDRVAGDLDGDGQVDAHDAALADVLAGLDEEARAEEDDAVEPGIMEEPADSEPLGKPEPDSAPPLLGPDDGADERHDLVYDPLAMALREGMDPPSGPGERTLSSFAADAVTLSQIGFELDEDGSPRMVDLEEVDSSGDWEPSDPLAVARLRSAGPAEPTDSEVDLDTLSSIFLRAEQDDDLDSELGHAEPLVAPLRRHEDDEHDSWVVSLDDDDEDLDPDAISAALEAAEADGPPSLVFDVGAVAPADPEDGPDHQELTAAIAAFEDTQELAEETPDLPPVEAAEPGTLSRIFEGGDPSGDFIDEAMGGWGIEASDEVAAAPQDTDVGPDDARADLVAAALADELAEDPGPEDSRPVPGALADAPEVPHAEAEPIPTTPEEEAMRRAFEEAWSNEVENVHSFVSASQIQDPRGTDDLHEALGFLDAESVAGVPDAAEEGPLEDLEAVEDLAPHEEPGPVPDLAAEQAALEQAAAAYMFAASPEEAAAAAQEVADSVPPPRPAGEPTFEDAAAEGDWNALAASHPTPADYAISPVRALEVGPTSESGTWNLVTEPWTPEEAGRVVEAILAAHEAEQARLTGRSFPEPAPAPEPARVPVDADGEPAEPGLISKIRQLEKGQRLRLEDLEAPSGPPLEPVFAVDAPGPPDPDHDWGEVEERLGSMPGTSPGAVSMPSIPTPSSVEKPDWAKTASEIAESPRHLAAAVDFASDDPLAALAGALEADREEASAPPSVPPPQAPSAGPGDEGPDWEEELRAQMEAGELGTRPPDPAVRPNSDDTEKALWELAHEELGGATERLSTLQTQLQTATRRAEAAERALEEARQEKSDVLTYTGNELRTPLEGILGMAELLRGTELDGEQRDMLDSLIHNAQLLYSLLRGIIETATLGSETANQDAVDLFEVIRGVVDELGGLAETREVVLLRSIQSGVPRMVEGDGDRVRVLLRNIMETALRFLEKGEMELVVSMEGALPSGPMLRFTLLDTGAGLPPELLALLDGTPLPPGFEDATGLGGTARVLAASQEMAVAMDGSIQAETVPGQGAQLFLILPFRWARRNSAEAGLKVAPGEDETLKASTGRVLLVEDNPIARKVTASMLEQLGRAPEIAETGEQAVHLVQRNDYGLVLLDTDLPDMGWSEVTRLIRAAEVQAGRRSVLLGLVPHNGPALQLCVAEGMDGVLDKPVELKYLQDTLERFLGSDFMRVRVRDEPPTSSDATRFDPGFLTKQFPGDHRAAYEVLEVFLMDADQLETKLINSVRSQNWGEVEEIGHSLKGVARSVGAARLAALAEDMETRAAGGEIVEAGRISGDVKTELAWLRGELAA